MKRLVAALAAFYFDVWARVPTVTRSKAKDRMGNLEGPFIGLMVEMARKLHERGLPFYYSAEALYSCWRELEPNERMRLDMVKTQASTA